MSKSTEDNSQTPWQVSKLEELEKNKQAIYFDIDDFLEVVEFYIYQGKYKRALEIAEYALRVHTGETHLMLKKAQLLASLNNETQALGILNELAIVDPNNSDIYLTKGAIHSQLRNYLLAIDEYLLALPNAEEPDYIYLSIAFEYENMGNYSNAIEFLDKALKANPDNHLALYELAYCFDLLGMNEESVAYFEKLIDGNPYNKEAWFNLGASYNNAGLYEKGIEAFDYALAIDDQHKNSWFYRGLSFTLLEKFGEALESFLHSIEDDEGDAVKYYHIGECYEKLEQFSTALENYRKATVLDHTLADAWAGMGVCEMEAGNSSKAIRHFIRGAELDPNNVSYICLLADAYATAGDMQRAQDTYEKAVAEQPTDAECWTEYADALWRNDLRKEALRVSQRALEILPTNSTILYRIAAFMWLTGNENDATYFLMVAIEQNYDEHKALLSAFPVLETHERFLKIVEQHKFPLQ